MVFFVFLVLVVVLLFLVVFLVLFVFLVLVFVITVVIVMVVIVVVVRPTMMRRMRRWWWRRRRPLHRQADIAARSNVLERSLDADRQQRRVAHVVGRVLAVGNVLHQPVRHAGRLGGAVLAHLGVVLFFFCHGGGRRVGSWEDGGERAEGRERQDAPRHDGGFVRGGNSRPRGRRLLLRLLLRHGDGGCRGGEERAQGEDLHDGGSRFFFTI